MSQKFRVEIQVKVRRGHTKTFKHPSYMVQAADATSAQMKALSMARDDGLEVFKIVSVDEVYH